MKMFKSLMLRESGDSEVRGPTFSFPCQLSSRLLAHTKKQDKVKKLQGKRQ